jgi:radical SAM family uncharacterized protein
VLRDLKSIGPADIRRRLDDILPHVEKPGRYFAGEIGLVRKDWGTAQARIVIAFPDVYEIAVVNLGHKLIQHVINSRDEYLCERVYSVWPDMEERLRETGTPLYALESYHQLNDFDVLGVSLSHELSFSNLLQLIDLAGLPLRSEERGFPIVICGGSVAFNPEPIADFVDAFVLGEGEEVTLDLVAVIAEHRNEIDKARGNPDAEREVKNRILDIWGGAGTNQGIKGVYIPKHFEVVQDDSGTIERVKNIAGGPGIIEKTFVKDLDSAPWVTEPQIPHMQGVSNRVTVEPVRGCTHGCRFCQAGMIYRPYRQRSIDLLVDQAETLLESTGQQEQSFLALSATDWPDLQDFIMRMKGVKRDFHLKISLPSNRIAALDRSLTDMLITNRKGGLTLAIEAATQRLRAVINKEVTEEDVMRGIENAVVSGWTLVKLYFMIGLPTETDDDVIAILDLVRRISAKARDLKKEGVSKVGRLKIKVSVSNFVPKPHTPFQWAPMDVPEMLDRKQKLLIDLRRIKGVDYSSHDIDANWLEGIMSRGDRRLSDVIENAYRLGARFDAWSDRANPEAWREAFRLAGIDPGGYLGGRDIDAVLPWDHLSCGVDREWLKQDWLRALDEMTLPDCNESSCYNCGMHSIHPECRPVRVK